MAGGNGNGGAKPKAEKAKSLQLSLPERSWLKLNDEQQQEARGRLEQLQGERIEGQAQILARFGIDPEKNACQFSPDFARLVYIPKAEDEEKRADDIKAPEKKAEKTADEKKADEKPLPIEAPKPEAVKA